MTTDPDPSADESFADRLAAWEQETPATPSDPADPDLTSKLRDRLGRARDCVRRLRRWGAARPAGDAPRRIGRFRIRRELGRGGFGVVFLAFDPRLGRRVALKVPRADALLTPEFRERFQTEARAAAGLDHPNLVPVYEAGQAGPVCYIVTAYCPGRTLRDWLRCRKAPVAFAVAAGLVAALADGVEHAHTRGVVHRDLKPANVLLRKSAAGADDRTPTPSAVHLPPAIFEPKVTDFGLAKFTAAGDGPTRTGAVMGTPCYMAPEQAGGNAGTVGPAADVYSLGTILYELLTGRPPFVGESDLDTLRQVTGHDPMPPSRLRPQTPRDLETVCLKCLEKDPGRRYPSAGALAADLRRFLAGEPVKARPVGPIGRLWRKARRRPAVAALAVAVLALLVAAAGLLWSKYEAAEGARRTEEWLLRANYEAEQRQRLELEETLAGERVASARAHWHNSETAQARRLLDEVQEGYRDPRWLALHQECHAELASLPISLQYVSRVVPSPDGKRLALFAMADGVHVVDAGDASTIAALPTKLTLLDIAFGADGQTLVVLARGRPFLRKPEPPPPDRVTVWDGSKPQPPSEWAFGPADRLVLSRGSLRVGTCTGNLIRVLDPFSRAAVSEFAEPAGKDPIRDIMIDDSGQRLAVVFPRSIHVWDIPSRRKTHTIPIVAPPMTGKCLFGPDGNVLAWVSRRPSEPQPSTSTNVLLTVWDIGRGQELFHLDLPAQQVAGPKFSSNGKLLAVTSPTDIHLLDPSSGVRRVTLRGHSTWVSDLAFSRDGHRLFSLSSDHVLKTWDVRPWSK